jgi:predicted ATP-grasp superfamily ATP-dependent carboligase
VTQRGCVIVTDAGRGSAISIIRSLAASGYRVIAADADPRSPGFRSRAVAASVLYPAPSSHPDDAVAALLAAARAHRADLLIPVTDEVILPLAASRDAFADVSVLAVPAPEALAVVTDKSATLALARRLGVPCPSTALVSTVPEAAEAGERLGWPVVLKPQASRVYGSGRVAAFAVSYACSAEELAQRMGRLAGRCDVLLQDFHRGEGHGVEVLMHEGRVLAAFQHRRLHEVPFTGGASSLRESVPLDPHLLSLSERMLSELRWTGLAMVEFKLGRDGPRLMEINGRVWGSLPLAVKSGMDFPRLLASLHLEGPPPAGPVATRYRVGVRSRNLELDIVWIASVLRGRTRYACLPAPPRRHALGALVGLLDPRCKYDILSLDDPRPGLAEIGKTARKFRGKLGEGS